MLCKICGKPVAPYPTDGRCEDCYALCCTGLRYTTDIYKEDEKKQEAQNLNEDEVLMQSIACLGLSTKEENILYSNDIELLEDLVEWSEVELMRIKGFGFAALQRVESGLASFGLTLSQPEPQKQT